MNKEVLNYIAEKTRELIVAPTCSNETKEAAQAWLNAIGTESEMAETKKYIAELGLLVLTMVKLILVKKMLKILKAMLKKLKLTGLNIAIVRLV